MASSAKDIQLLELKDTITQLKTMISEQTELIRSVFCKTFLHKIAKTFCRSLQLHFVGNCKPGWQSWYLPAI